MTEASDAVNTVFQAAQRSYILLLIFLSSFFFFFLFLRGTLSTTIPFLWELLKLVVVAAALCFVWLLLSTLRPHARPVCRAFVVTAHRRSVRKHVSLFFVFCNDHLFLSFCSCFSAFYRRWWAAVNVERKSDKQTPAERPFKIIMKNSKKNNQLVRCRCQLRSVFFFPVANTPVNVSEPPFCLFFFWGFH